MKVFTCNSFRGHYPVGTAAVVVADDKHSAAKLLEDSLMASGLAQKITSAMVEEVDADLRQVIILSNGDY